MSLAGHWEYHGEQADPVPVPVQAPALGSRCDSRRDGGNRGHGGTQKDTSPRLMELGKDSPKHVTTNVKK